MKKFAIIIISLIGICACNNSNEFQVVASIEGVEDGTQVLVRKLGDNNNFVILDTLFVEKEKFTYSGIAGIPETHSFYIDGTRGGVPFITEPGAITVAIYKDSLNASVVAGTPYNDDFNNLKAEMKKVVDKIFELRRKAGEAMREQDSAAVDRMRSEYVALQKRSVELQKNFALENPRSYVTAIVLKQLLFTNARDVTPEEIQSMYDALPENIKATREAKDVGLQLYKTNRTAIGAVAPDFSAPTPEGETLSLKDVKGKATLIVFWETQSEKCRAEHPHLVALYHKYHGKGLNMISVALDKKVETWKQAIEEDGLVWHHVSNLKRRLDPIAKTYNIKTVPANFVLDEAGKIVAKNLTGETLEAKIEEILR